MVYDEGGSNIGALMVFWFSRLRTAEDGSERE